ncbi:MAG: hypothetical protein EOP38_17435 [Rubrivivax sp.]|nr:MAG: hypothetical protein EOP38_17435 [Rubrivivax sp.]
MACASSLKNSPAPLYQQLGGVPAITQITDRTLDRVSADPRTKRSFAKVKMKALKESVAAYVCQVADGPCKYEGETMAKSHAELGITGSEFDVMVEVLREEIMAQAAVSVMVKGVRPTAQATATADMAQKGRAFQPGLLVVQTGTSVLFPNFDTVRHHVYSFSATKKFELKLYSGTPAAPVVFDKPGTATLGCNIHDQMLGYIHVVDTPFFGVTGSDGQVNLDLPAGEHRLRVWWPALGETNPGVEQTIKTGGSALTVRVKG